MSHDSQVVGPPVSGVLAGVIAGALAAPLFVMVGLAVLLNWGRS